MVPSGQRSESKLTVWFLRYRPTADPLAVDLHLYTSETYTMSSTARINQTIVKLIWKKSNCN